MGSQETQSSSESEWIIEARRSGLFARLRELNKFRYLLPFFFGRALRRTYARTLLGWGWVVVRPVVPILLFTLVFGSVIGIPSGDVPYLLHFLVGMTAWSLFESSTMWATRSIEINRKIVSQIYFPRLILPISTVGPAVVEACVHIVLMAVAAVYYLVAHGTAYVIVSHRLLGSVIALFGCMLLAISIGLWTSVLGSTVRDVRFTMRYVLTLWFFATPVLYPSSLVPPRWQWILIVNPVVPLVDAMRWSLLGAAQPNATAILTSVLLTVALLAGGLWFFGWREAVAADRI